MLRKTVIAIAFVGSLAISAPALAGNHHSSSTSGWNGSTSGWNNSSSSSGGHTSSTSGYSSTSGTEVPEPGTLGLAGLGLMGLGAIRLRRRRA